MRDLAVMACGGEDTFKLPMRRWLSDLVDKGEIDGLEWFHKDQKSIKIPWTKMHHPGWQSCEKVVTAWAEHQHRDEKKGAKSDFSTLKANFRNALRKSEDFEEDKNESQLDNQTGNFKVYRILTRAEVEANKQVKKKANADPARKRKKQSNSSAGGKSVCSEQNYDDGLLKKVADKDLNSPGSSQFGCYSPGICISPPLTDSKASYNMNFQNNANTTEEFDVNLFEHAINGNTTVVPMQCTSDGSFIDPLAESMLQNNIQCTQDLASMATPSLLEENKRCLDLFHLFELPIHDLHVCELTVTYNSSQVLEDELRTTDKGYRLHYGDEKDLKQVFEFHFLSDSEQNDYKLSSIRLPNPKSEFQRLQDILNVTELGLTFRYDEGTRSFYMKRLCQSQIFYLDPHVPQKDQKPIKIERNQEMCIFSYERFLTAVQHAIVLDDKQQLVYPILHFSIGSKSNLEKPPSPRGIKCKIIINRSALKHFLEESIVLGEMSCHVSRPNEMDKMLKQFKDIKM